MYDKIKILLNHPTYRYIIIGSIGFILILCLVELNRSIQRSIDRSQTIAVKQRQELNEAHNTINKLENELTQAKLQSMKQEIVLSEMQNSLTELKGQIDNDKRTIKRLRMQRNLSQILGAGATIGVVIHR